MKPVYLCAWKRIQLDASRDAELLAQPLIRRMTPLQKAALICFHHLAQEFPEAREFAQAARAPLFLTSAFGEIGPMLRITQSILDHDLPVSPKDFQHSVLNASVSYLAISQNWHQAGYALSGGFAGPDSTLHLAAQRLRYELDEASIVMHVHEHYAQKFEAEAELMILSRNRPLSGFHLETSALMPAIALKDLPGGPLRSYKDGKQDYLVPWLIESEGPVLRRFVRTRKEQGWVTVWTRC